MRTYEIHANATSHGESFQWNFRESKWVDMTTYRGDGTGMSTDNHDEANQTLPFACIDADGLRGVCVVCCDEEED